MVTKKKQEGDKPDPRDVECPCETHDKCESCIYD